MGAGLLVVGLRHVIGTGRQAGMGAGLLVAGLTHVIKAERKPWVLVCWLLA